MPEEKTSLSDRERQLVEQVAQQRGITFEQASQELAREGLARRMRRGTGHAPAKVYDIATRRKS